MPTGRITWSRLWSQVFRFLQSDTGKTLTSVLGFPGIRGLQRGRQQLPGKHALIATAVGGGDVDPLAHVGDPGLVGRPCGKPLIGVPTTSGTGSEAQSYALISDAKTHVKMACSDLSSRFRLALLDPELTVTQPTVVTAITGYDALAHAVETAVTTQRNALSDLYSREAFRLLNGNYVRVLEEPEDLEARSAMQLGAFYAGVAIDSMKNPAGQAVGFTAFCAANASVHLSGFETSRHTDRLSRLADRRTVS